MVQASFDFDYDPAEIEREIQIRRDETEIVLTGYQNSAVDGIFGKWAGGDRSTLLVLATGLGKSVVFSEVMRRWSESAT